MEGVSEKILDFGLRILDWKYEHTRPLPAFQSKIRNPKSKMAQSCS